MKCQRCESVNPDGSVFCNVCGARIMLSGNDSDEPYVVWRGIPGHFFSTTSMTRDQYLTTLAITIVVIGAVLIFSLAMGIIWFGIPLVVLVAVIIAVYWVWGRDEAKKRP